MMRTLRSSSRTCHEELLHRYGRTRGTKLFCAPCWPSAFICPCQRGGGGDDTIDATYIALSPGFCPLSAALGLEAILA